jgi:hypothetical protein
MVGDVRGDCFICKATSPSAVGGGENKASFDGTRLSSSTATAWIAVFSGLRAEKAKQGTFVTAKTHQMRHPTSPITHRLFILHLLFPFVTMTASDLHNQSTLQEILLRKSKNNTKKNKMVLFSCFSVVPFLLASHCRTSLAACVTHWHKGIIFIGQKLLPL